VPARPPRRFAAPARWSASAWSAKVSDPADGARPAYDSAAETLAHIHKLRDRIEEFVVALLTRGRVHDASKLVPPEKPGFDAALGELGRIPFGSPDYEALVAKYAPLIALHHANNRHHPEHHGDAGIAGMDLVDLVEMVCDWIAAAERVPGQAVDLAYSVRAFGISRQLEAILANTLARWPTAG
jgi:hypothetical protein